MSIFNLRMQNTIIKNLGNANIQQPKIGTNLKYIESKQKLKNF